MDSLQSSIEYLLNNLREPNDHQEQITDDGSLTILNTEKTFSGLIDDGNKEKNNNEITQGTYNSKLNLQPRQKYKNSSQDEIKFEETGGNHISTLTPQKAEEISLDQNYLGDNYPADYTQEHYNQYASYDSSQYQEYFNQQYSQDHQYPQNQTFLPEEQFLEKDNFQA